MRTRRTEYEKILGEGAAWQSETLGQLAGESTREAPAGRLCCGTCTVFLQAGAGGNGLVGPANGTLTDGAAGKFPARFATANLCS